MFSSVSEIDTLKNIATKDLATDSIQDSLLHAKEHGQEEVRKFVRNRLIKNTQNDKPDVSIHERLHKNRSPTFANLYEVVKDTKDKSNKSIMKADRNVLQRLITAYESGRPVDLPSVLKHELLPVPLSLAEMNGALRTGNKSILEDVLIQDTDCPDRIQLHDTSSCLIIDGQALLVALGKPPGAVNFGDLADIFVETILRKGSQYQRIDIVFDRYREQTIKGTTRKRRAKAARPIRRCIEGRHVPLPKDWFNFLSLIDNKADLSHFLSEELYLQAPAGKEIVVAGGFRDELEVKSSNHVADL